MRRREFITLLGGTAAGWPLVASAQQRQMSVVGILRSASADNAINFLAPFSEGLREFSYVDGQNVTIDYRSVPNYDRLPEVAAELVRNKVAVIVASGAVNVSLAARAATSTIPIVFVIGSDPVEHGLVASLNRPGGNVTGVTLIGSQLIPKRVELLRQILGSVAAIGFLVNPNNPNAEPEVRGLEALSRAGGWVLNVVAANAESDLDAAFATLVRLRSRAFLHSSDVFFAGQYPQMVALATRHSLPAIFTRREAALAGGLVSYGTRPADMYRVAGTFTGRILRGAKPADLPVQQPTKFELILNLKTAKTLGLTVPPILLATADEVIE